MVERLHGKQPMAFHRTGAANGSVAFPLLFLSIAS
jgi:hypothetical protein